MEDEKKKLNRWLRLGNIYQRVMPALLTLIGAYLLVDGILVGGWKHGFATLGAFVVGLAVAYFPRFIIWHIKRSYAGLVGEQPKMLFFQVPQQGQPDFETQLKAEMLKLTGHWPNRVGSDKDR